MNKNQKLDAFRKATRTYRKSATATRKSNVRLVQSVASPKTTNADGFPAFKDTSIQQSAARVVLCGIIKNTYYIPKEIQAGEAVDILKECARVDPLYLLKLAVLARKNNLKFMVKMIVAALSPYDDFTVGHEDTIVNLLKTFHPGQLLEYVELQKSAVFGKGLGSRQQRWVAKAIESWNEENTVYYTLKYRRDFNILIRLVHPRPALYRDYVLDGKPRTLHARQRALNSIKESQDVKKIAETMIEHDIPWDVIKGFAPSTDKMWFAYMQQSGTNALLLNTRNYRDHGVFTLTGGFDEYKRLLSAERVQRARLLPLDIAKTITAVRGECDGFSWGRRSSTSELDKFLAEVFAQSFLTPIEGLADKRVAVSIDQSGSMNGETLMTAATVAASFIHTAKRAWITGFSTELYEEGSREMPKLSGVKPETMVSRLFTISTHGGTDTSLSVKKALQNGEVFDYFVILTDEQQNTGCPLIEVFNTYRKRVNSNAVLIIVNVTTTPWRSATNDEHTVLFNTVTPTLFKSMAFLGQDLVSLVRSVELETTPTESKEEDLF